MYFSNIKKIIVDVNGDGVFDVLSNLTAKVKISDDLIDNAGFYETIEVKDGERPDHLSERLYDTPIYHWTFLLLNKRIKNVWNDWPMKYSQLKEYCENKYEHIGAVTEEDLTNKFVIGEDIKGILSHAISTIKEIHVNKGYIVIEMKTIKPEIIHIATSGQTEFTFTFPTYIDSDVTVYKGDTLQRLDIEYTVSGENSSSGTIITMSDPTLVNEVIKITGLKRTFKETGESILGSNTQDSIFASHIKSTAYAPHHHVDDSTGEIVSKRTAGTTPFTYFDYESDIHDKNKTLKVIKAEHIDEVASKFIKLMRQ